MTKQIENVEKINVCQFYQTDKENCKKLYKILKEDEKDEYLEDFKIFLIA